MPGLRKATLPPCFVLCVGIALLTAAFAQASFPGSPGLIALQRSADPDTSAIWVLDPRTGSARQLTQEGFDTEPAFSPDGEWIAFSSDNSRGGYLNIWAIRPDGRELHRLTHTGLDLEAGEPAFSADGRWVAFLVEAPGGGYQVDRVPASGGRPQVLIPGDSANSAFSPSFSPDGHHLAWEQGPEVVPPGHPPRIFVGGPNRRGGHPLTNGSEPEFSPDSQSIVLTRQRRCAKGRGAEIDTLSLLTRQLFHLVQSCGARLYEPTYSPDGAWIAYTVSSGGRSHLGFVAVPGSAPLFTLPPGLGTDLPVDQAPSWQPL
jgi:Tol biopolymer transport system component